MVGLGENGCGIACEQTLYPAKCLGFSHYQVEGKEDLCFLFSEVIDVEVFEKPEKSAALLQQRQGAAKKEGSPAAAVCKVKMSEITMGYKPKGELKKNKRCFGSCDGFEARSAVEKYSIPDTVEVDGKEVIEKLS